MPKSVNSDESTKMRSFVSDESTKMRSFIAQSFLVSPIVLAGTLWSYRRLKKVDRTENEMGGSFFCYYYYY